MFQGVRLKAFVPVVAVVVVVVAIVVVAVVGGGNGGGVAALRSKTPEPQALSHMLQAYTP